MASYKFLVHIGASGPVIFQGGDSPFGLVIELRPSTKDRPGFRLSPRPDQLRRLPPGSDADFEFTEIIPADKFPR